MCNSSDVMYLNSFFFLLFYIKINIELEFQLFYLILKIVMFP